MTNPSPAPITVAPIGIWDRLAILALGSAGCALSYDALQQMAVAIHVRGNLTYLFPLVIDGFIAYGVRALLVLSTAPLRARAYVWMLFGTATTASIWANSLHAVRLNQQTTHSGLRLGDTVVAILSTLAPLALAGAVHLYILITRHRPATLTGTVGPTGDRVPSVPGPQPSQSGVSPWGRDPQRDGPAGSPGPSLGLGAPAGGGDRDSGPHSSGNGITFARAYDGDHRETGASYGTGDRAHTGPLSGSHPITAVPSASVPESHRAAEPKAMVPRTTANGDGPGAGRANGGGDGPRQNAVPDHGGAEAKTMVPGTEGNGTGDGSRAGMVPGTGDGDGPRAGTVPGTGGNGDGPRAGTATAVANGGDRERTGAVPKALASGDGPDRASHSGRSARGTGDRSPVATGPRSSSRARLSEDEIVARIRPHVPAVLERTGNEAITRVQLRQIMREQQISIRNENLTPVLHRLRSDSGINAKRSSTR